MKGFALCLAIGALFAFAACSPSPSLAASFGPIFSEPIAYDTPADFPAPVMVASVARYASDDGPAANARADRLRPALDVASTTTRQPTTGAARASRDRWRTSRA